MAFVSVTLRLVLMACVYGVNASRLKGTYRPVYGLPTAEMNNLTLAKYPETSEIGCARLCLRYTACTSFSLAPGLCTLMMARTNVRREVGGMDFYIINEVETPDCVQEAGSIGGSPFNLSSAYYASYHFITGIRLYYTLNDLFLRGLEVEHGSDVASVGSVTDRTYECLLATNEFIQRLEYSQYYLNPTTIVFGCITLVTTHKTCGPYGNECGPTNALGGYKLLYFAGRNWDAFDQLSLAFDSC